MYVCMYVCIVLVLGGTKHCYYDYCAKITVVLYEHIIKTIHAIKELWSMLSKTWVELTITALWVLKLLTKSTV